MVLYMMSSSKALESDELRDVNGIPLFLHEPLGLENDQHRNSLKHPHQVRMKLSFRMNNNLKDVIANHEDTLENTQKKSADHVFDVEKREIKYAHDHDYPNDFSENDPGGVRTYNEEKVPVKSLQTKPPIVPLDPQGNPSYMNGGVQRRPRVHFLNKDEQIQPRKIETEELDQDKIKILLNPAALCEENRGVYLLIAVVSDIKRFKLRSAIRKTWGRVAANGRFATKLIFVIGRPQEKDAALSEMIESENREFGDILYLDLEDKHTLLTYKTLAMFQWTLEYCNQAKYILKTDDDVFINIPNILQDLKVMEGNQPVSFMLGHVIDGAKPITNRQDKWFSPGGQFKGKSYPTYLSGSAYVLPSTLLEPIMQKSREIKIFWLEDVYVTGILAEQVQAALIHNAKFEYRKRKLGPCRFKKLNSAHELSPEDLRFVWREMNRVSLKCANTDGHFLKSMDYDLHP